MNINVLELFRTGTFQGVRSGYTRDQVETILGKPDVSVPGIDVLSNNYQDAQLWYYAGIQFQFLRPEEHILNDIGFRPFYLHDKSQYRDLENERTKLNLWIFANEPEPTVEELRLALTNEGIAFQDTGLESCIFDNKIKNFKLVPYQPDLEDSEAFGTLVLKSGMQIRYLEDGAIERVADSGKIWMVKGKEQSISWLNRQGSE